MKFIWFDKISNGCLHKHILGFDVLQQNAGFCITNIRVVQVSEDSTQYDSLEIQSFY